MKQILKVFTIFLGFTILVPIVSLAEKHWAPIIMEDITTFVPYEKLSIKTHKKYYTPNETVTANIQGELSGDQDWIGIFSAGDNNDWGNVIAWNWVKKSGSVQLILDKNDMPAGAYEVRIFFHNEFGANAVVRARYAFHVKSDDAGGGNVTYAFAKMGNYQPKEYRDAYQDEKYFVYYPEDHITADMPVVLFLEGGGSGLHVDKYSGIMKYLASYGYFVIGGETGEGYDIAYYTQIFDNAINAAKAAHGLEINKLIVMGHSQGGGDVFYVMKHFQDQGYGSGASLALSIDGWFAFDMNQADLRGLRGRVSFLQMNGVEGTGTDPRIKLSIWNLASQTDRKFLTLRSGTEHMYVSGDLNSMQNKPDLTGVIGALVDDAINGTNSAYNALPDARKSSYNEIYNNLRDPSQYHGGDCAGEQYNAKGELERYDIEYCHPEDYR